MIKRIKVGHLVYTVNLVDRLPDGDLQVGLCTSVDMAISLKTGQPEDALRSTLLHEVMHAIHQVYGHGKEKMSDEYVARLVEVGMMNVMRDNPALVRFLGWA